MEEEKIEWKEGEANVFPLFVCDDQLSRDKNDGKGSKVF